MIYRDLQKNILKHLLQRKVILLLGARQVGAKNHLIESYLPNKEPSSLAERRWNRRFANFWNCKYKYPVFTTDWGGNKLVIIDEAQQISDIGRKLN